MSANIRQSRALFDRLVAGETAAALAAELGLTRGALYARWRCMGLAPPEKRPRRDVLRQLHERRLEGESTEALAAEVGICPSYLRALWVRLGLKAAHAPRARRRAS